MASSSPHHRFLFLLHQCPVHPPQAPGSCRAQSPGELGKTGCTIRQHENAESRSSDHVHSQSIRHAGTVIPTCTRSVDVLDSRMIDYCINDEVLCACAALSLSLWCVAHERRGTAKPNPRPDGALLEHAVLLQRPGARKASVDPKREGHGYRLQGSSRGSADAEVASRRTLERQL